MKITEMMSSKYFKVGDVESQPVLVTIDRFEEENVAPADKPKQMKWVAYFKETDKGLVMSTTNLQLAAIALGSQDTDLWIGKQLVLFNDPTVSFQGKITGGVRVRAKKGAKPEPQPTLEEMDDDIPF
jgi:hypothetical protein